MLFLSPPEFLLHYQKRMKKIHWHNPLLLFLHICVIFFIILSEKSSAADPQYEACVPRDCGNGVSISFPFYIPGLQPPYCGYKGFELNCSSYGYPTIHMLENDYVVEKIFYENRIFRVYNTALRSLRESCFSELRNVTSLSSHFKYVSVARIYLLSNCNGRSLEQVRKNKIDCGNGSTNGWKLAVFENDAGNLNYALKVCEKNVVALVEVDGGDGGSNRGMGYEGLFRRGFALSWEDMDCSRCEQSGGRCGISTDSNKFRCFCPDMPHLSICKGRRRTSFVAIFAVGISAAIMVIVVILIAYFKRKHWVRIKNSKDNQNVEALLKSYGFLAPKRYSYSAVKKMTNLFIDKLGQGGYGSVYKGKLQNGSLVAVKVLDGSKGNGEDFINEVVSVGRTSHVHIVALLGFCFEGSKRALIYEFMPNGSLETFIHRIRSSAESRLGWQTLFQIAVGVARGLEYLHQGCNTRILHFDIKPHNILLDKDFCPKISDFGLAKLCPNRASQISMLGARGTAGYIAPEIFNRNLGRVSHKSDIYSYGMMILEMVGGRRNIDVQVDHTSEIYFPHWIHNRLQLNDDEILLEGITNEDENERVRKMIIVGLWCIQIDPKQRPSTDRVLEMFDGNLDSLPIPPRP